MNLSELYEKMRTIRVKNERMEKARESLKNVSSGSTLEHKDSPKEKLPSQ